MSLEERIAQLTAAVEENNRLLQASLGGNTTAPDEKPAAPKKSRKKAAKTAAPPATEEQQQAAPPPPPAPPTAPATAAVLAEPGMDVTALNVKVSEAVRVLGPRAGEVRDLAMRFMTAQGAPVTRLPDLQPQDYGTFIQQLDAIVKSAQS